MLKKIITSLIITGLVASTASYANEKPKCPSVEAIKSHALERADQIPGSGGTWGAFVVDNFDTDRDWGFNLLDIVADNEDDAISKASELVKNLVFAGGPYRNQYWYKWACVYFTASGNRAVAGTDVV